MIAGSPTQSGSLGEALQRLQVGSEVLWEPERMRPFEHWVGHIPFAFWIIAALRPRVFVELGTHRGNSYLAFCQAINALNVDSRAYAVDTWQGDEHMAFEQGLFEELSSYHDPKYGHFSSLVRSPFDEARNLFSDGSIDLLHIDGTHTYEEVLNDFRTWETALSDRAVVLMHDVNVRRERYGVWKVWEELSHDHPHFEFFHSYGLGVLGIGKNLPEPVKALFRASSNPSEAGHIRSFFAARGKSAISTLFLQMERSRKEEEILQIARELDGARHRAATLAEEQSRATMQLEANLREKAEITDLHTRNLREKAEIIDLHTREASLRRQESETFLKRSTESNIKIAQMEIQAAEMNEQYADLVALRLKLETDLATRSAQLHEVWTSTSWRITAPLRSVVRRLRRNQIVRAMPSPGTPPSVGAVESIQTVTIAQSEDDKPASEVINASVNLPDLFSLRAFRPSSKIAVVAHIFYPELANELLDATVRLDEPHDLFITLVEGQSDYLKAEISARFPKAMIWVFPNRGRDILPFMSLINTGAFFAYELICKLHTKRSPHRADGDKWRQHLISGVLPSKEGTKDIVAAFRQYPDLGLVIADGQIFHDAENWSGNVQHLKNLLPFLSLDIDRASQMPFAGGSIFWIRPWVLRDIVGLNLKPAAYEPEPVLTDGSLAHAVERLFSVVCHAADLRIEQASLVGPGKMNLTSTPRLAPRVVAFYLPQFHPTPENDEWWGPGFTEWTNVTKAEPLFAEHRQPRLPGELGFTDLRVAETRKAQADLAREYGVSAFCYYYYWFDGGRRLLNRPLDEVLASGEPEFPFMICWANEPWSRNWDGLNKDVLMPQTYMDGWVDLFADDIAPVLKDRRYLRVEGTETPILFIYRLMNIPDPVSAVAGLREALKRNGIPAVHIAAARLALADDKQLPNDPAEFGLDAFFEFPPHGVPAVAVPESERPANLTGGMYDYGRTVDAARGKLNDSDPAIPVHFGAMMGWDNTARRGSAAHIFKGATPANFRRWMRGVVKHWYTLPDAENRLVLVNAWNEWAEGTCLEPDRDFGRGWLEAVRSAVGNPDEQ